MAGPNVPEPIRALAAAVRSSGGRAFLVGGGVRDHLMGQPVKDWDVEVFGVDAEALTRLLRRMGAVNAVGRSFGVFKWTPRDGPDEEIDVSIPRRDSKVGPGHKGIAVEGDPSMPTVEAARRRDLTINALMWDLAEERLEDPYHGLRDLEGKRLRAVDRTTFLEDPLRALRVVQFVARLGFEPDDELIAMCREAQLDELPAERIQGEWGKLLLKGRAIDRALDVARRAAIPDRVFPEWAAIRPAVGPNLDRLAAGPRGAVGPEGRQWALMLVGWLLGAAAAAPATLDRLGMFTIRGYPVRDRVLEALDALAAPVATDTDLRRLSTRAELRLVLTVRQVVDGTDPAVLARAAALGVDEGPPKALLLGRHLKALGVAPGPAMGQLLHAVYELQLDGLVTTPDEAREAARSRLTPS